MIPRSRILVSFQNPPGPFLKNKQSYFYVCLGREERMQGKHVITRQLPYHGLGRATQQFAFFYCFAFYGC